MQVECVHEKVPCRTLGDCGGDEEKLVDRIRLAIALEGDLADEQRDRLGYIASRCPIHRMLDEKPRIEQTVSVVRPASG